MNAPLLTYPASVETAAPGGAGPRRGDRTGAPSQLFTEPPRGRDRLGAWLLLALCLAMAAGPMVMDLPGPDVTDPAEARSVAISMQSWRRQSQLTGTDRGTLDRIVPHLNGQPLLRDPPGPTWLHGLAFSSRGVGQMATDEWVFRARLVSVAMAVLTVAAVYWAGVSIGGTTTGLCAALVCAASPVFIYQARLASGAMPHVGWVLLSTAAALWAIRPMKPAASVVRQAIGWGLCGVALGAAVLTAGAAAISEICLPILLVLVLCPNRLSHSLGLLASVLIGVLMVLPWAGHVQGQDSGTWQVWLDQLAPGLGPGQNLAAMSAGQGIVLSGLVLLPWTPWLIVAVIQPFSASSAGLRGRMFLGWVWFASVAVLRLFVYGSARPDDVLVLVPPCAVLIGHLFHQYEDLAAQGRFPRAWRLLRWPQVVLLAIASVSVPMLLNTQPALIDRGLLGRPLTSSMSWSYAVGMGVALVLAVGLSARWVYRQQPGRVLVSWAVWVLVLAWMVAIPAARGPAAINPVRQEAARLAWLTGGHPVYWCRRSVHDASQPDPGLTLYFGRPIPPVVLGQVQRVAGKGEQAFLLTRAGNREIDSNGRQAVAHLVHTGLVLWPMHGEVPDAGGSSRASSKTKPIP